MTFTDPSSPGNQPTGVPTDDHLDAAHAINGAIGRLINLPRPNTVGVLHSPGRGDEIERAALVSIALSLTDIAESLREANERPRGGA